MTTDNGTPTPSPAPVPADAPEHETPEPERAQPDERQEPEREEQDRPEPEQHDFSREGGYALEVPSYVPRSAVTEEVAGQIEEYGVLAKELNVPADAAQALLETYADAALALPEGMHAGFNPHETTAILRHQWGAEYDHNLKLVQDTARALGPKFCNWLDTPRGPDGSRLSDHPAVCQALLVHAKGFMRLTPAQAQAALDKIMKDQKHPYWTGDKGAVADVAALRKRVSGTAGKGSATQPAIKPPTEPTGREKAETELRTIRMDKGYWDKSAPNHRALQARVQAIHAELHPEEK